MLSQKISWHRIYSMYCWMQFRLWWQWQACLTRFSDRYDKCDKPGFRYSFHHNLHTDILYFAEEMLFTGEQKQNSPFCSGASDQPAYGSLDIGPYTCFCCGICLGDILWQRGYVSRRRFSVCFDVDPFFLPGRAMAEGVQHIPGDVLLSHVRCGLRFVGRERFG